MKIEMKHGAGGAAMEDFIKNEILAKFDFDVDAEVGLERLDDASVINGVVLTTDSYTVSPIFFAGGNIGNLAVSGSINDVYAIGGKAIAMSSSFIIEEGFEMDDFRRIIDSMVEEAKKGDVAIITGDTKVVEKGSVDKIFINTAAIGKRHPKLDENFEEVEKYRSIEKKWLLDSNIRDGDKIIVTGSIGDHGATITAARYEIDSSIKSDAKPLNRLMDTALSIGGIVAAKDPTRGGVANLLNEWREKSNIGFIIDEKELPIKEGVKSLCELLGIDALELANEGIYVMAVVPEKAEEILEEIRKMPEGKNASIIGEASRKYEYAVLKTEVGGKRIIEAPTGNPVPRIC